MLALTLLWAGLAEARAGVVTFHVEVPQCTPPRADVLLHSNRTESTAFNKDVLNRIDRTHYEGTFEVNTAPSQLRYKYLLAPQRDGEPASLEKDIAYRGSGGDVPARRLEAEVDEVFDFVFYWGGALLRYEDKEPPTVRPAAQQVAFCAPYLGINSEEGAVSIGYDAYFADAVTLEYGLTDQFEAGRITLEGSHRNHFRLGSLEAGRRYHYRVIEDGIAGPEYTFRAPPPVKGGFRFVFLGDTQYYGEEHRLAMEKIVKHMLVFDPHLAVSGGDMVASTHGDGGGFDPPEMGRWSVFFAEAAPLMARVPLMAAMGNHEEDALYFWDAFDYPISDPPGEDHYTFRFGNTLFVVLYTGVTLGYDVDGILESQNAWLEATLAAAARKSEVRWKVVVLHRGSFSQGSSHPWDGFEFLDGRGGKDPSWRELFRSYGVDLVLAGHNHNFTLAYNDGTHYVTSCAGAPVHPLREPWDASTVYAEASCSADLFEVDNKILALKAFRVDGTEIRGARRVLCHQDSDCAALEASCGKPTWRCQERACVSSCPEGTRVQPERILFVAEEGGPIPPPQTVTVRDEQGFTREWVASCSPLWLLCLPLSGSTPAQIQVGVDTAGLGEAVYHGTVSLTSDTGTSIASIPVTLEIRAPGTPGSAGDTAPAEMLCTAGHPGAYLMLFLLGWVVTAARKGRRSLG